jgi:hypothetical protein
MRLPQPGLEQVYVMKFMRACEAYRAAILDGEQLRGIRTEMEAAGCPYLLESGAKVFVWPEQYQSVLHALHKEYDRLYASHVIVSESLVPLVEESIDSIPSKKNVRRKSIVPLFDP